METTQATQEQITVYDFDDPALDIDFPAKAIYVALRPLVESVIENPVKARDANHGVLEIVRNVEEHSLPDRPRLILVQKDMGGVAINTLNTIRPNSEQFGWGLEFIHRIFGSEYQSTIVGDTYMGHLYIPHETTGLIRLNES